MEGSHGESGAFELRTRKVGALPVLQHILARLDLDRLLNGFVPIRDARVRVPPGTALGVLLRIIVLGRHPLYALLDWAAPYAPELLGLNQDQVTLLNDDRVGRALDALFDADRASLVTAVVVRAIEEFDLDLDQFHNDSASITFSGDYRNAKGRSLRGKQALRITHGHNKDDRPDLKQLLWILTPSVPHRVRQWPEKVQCSDLVGRSGGIRSGNGERVSRGSPPNLRCLPRDATNFQAALHRPSST